MGGKGLLKRYVLCLCDCGNPEPVEKNLADLRKQDRLGKTPPSCGHGRNTAEDFLKYVGSKLGTLTILEMVKKFGHNNGAGFRCLCDCGVEATFTCTEMVGRCEEINPKYAYIMNCEKTSIDWNNV